jgi:putative transposase
MAERMTQQLALAALTMAYWREKPAPGLIHHSDRGSQYCSQAYRERLADYKMSASMSRKGNCWDNAPMESWNHSLKVERVNARRYETRAQAKSDVFDWIEFYYNVRRRHSALGYLSPREFARAYKTDQHRAA